MQGQGVDQIQLTATAIFDLQPEHQGKMPATLLDLQRNVNGFAVNFCEVSFGKYQKKTTKINISGYDWFVTHGLSRRNEPPITDPLTTSRRYNFFQVG